MSRTRTQKKRPAILATSVAAMLGLGLLLGIPRAAADQYWDGSNPTNTVVNGSGGSGTWDNSTANWSDGTGSGAADNPYDSVDQITTIFATMGGTVTLGDNITFNSLRFQANGYIIDGAGTFTLTPSGSGPIYVTSGNGVTISAQITGTNGLSLQGDDTTGTITLSNPNNNYTGGTTIGNGGTGPTVSISSDGNLGADSTNTLTMDGGVLQTTQSLTLPSARSILLNSSQGLTAEGGTFSPNSTTILEIDSEIDGNGALTMGGAGTLLLTNTSNTYSGGTFLNSGTLSISADGNLGNPSGPLTFAGGTLQTTATITSGRSVTINAGGGTFSPNVSTTFTDTGAVVLNDTLLMAGAGTLDLTGTITGTGGISMGGAGMLILAGTGSSYSGATTVASGTLQAGAANALSSASAVIVDTGTTFDLNSFSQNVGSISGAGSITLGAGTLTTGNDNTSTTFSGTISGTGGLTKVGTGALTLSSANAYSGATTLDSGTLNANNNGALGTGALVLNGGTIGTTAASNITLANPVVVGGNFSFATPAGVSLILTSTIDLGGGTRTISGASTTSQLQLTNVISDGALTKAGPGTLTLSGANTYSGPTTVNGGVLVIVPSSAVPTVLNSASALVVGGGEFQFDGLSTPTTQVLNGLTVNGGSSIVAVDVATPGVVTTLDLRGTSGTLGITRNGNGLVDFDAIGGTLGVDALILTHQANDATGIIGAWATVNGGSGFASNNGSDVIVPYTGYIDINAQGATIPDNPNGNFLINAPGAGGNDVIALPLTRINTLTQGSTTASIIDTSPGTLRLGTAGAIVITPGGAALTIGTVPNSGTLSAGEDTQTVPAILTLTNNSANLLTINSVIADNGKAPVSVAVDGTGTTVFAGNNTYSGSTAVYGGTLQMAATNSLPSTTALIVDTSGTLNLNNFSQSVGSIADGPNGGGTITLGTGTLTTGNDNTSTTFSGVIQGTGGLAKVGTGTQTLAGANTYTGATIVSAGTLNLTGSLTGSNITTTGSGIVSESSTGAISGAGASFTQGSSGTSTLAGANTYTGATIVSAGALSLTGSLTGSNISTSGSGNFLESSTGVIGGATATFTQGSIGASTLTAANTYGGGTTLVTGTLNANGNLADGSGTPLGTGTLTIKGGTIGTTIETTNGAGTMLTNSVSIQGDFSVATNVDANNPGAQNLTFAGAVDLGSATRTITGIIPGGQVSFSNVIGGSGGVTFNTTPVVNNDPNSDYVSFIYSGTAANTYTGLTTVEGHSILVFEKTTANAAVVGNLDVEGNGSADYIIGTNSPPQLTSTATVTDNSPGVTLGGGSHFDGLELRGASDTIGTLNGTNPLATVGLGSGTLTITQGGNFAGIIEDGQFFGGDTGTTGGNLVLNAPGGTLTIGGLGFYSGSTVLTAGTLQVNQTISAEYDGVISGAGTLIKTGPAELALGGNNTFTGGVVLNQGTLAIVTTPFSTGTITSPGTAITVNNATGIATIVNSGTITGTTAAIDASASSGLKIFNTGTINGPIIFSPVANTIVLATQMPAMSPTPLIVPPAGSGNNNTLELAGSAFDTLNATAATNFQFLNKVGGGLWTLTGTGYFPGGTTISGGTLAVQGTLVSNVVVQPAGMLGGTGVINGNVLNSGIVMPGTFVTNLPPIIVAGTLSVKGNYAQSPTGVLTIQVNGTKPGQYSQLSIGGQAQLGGALLVQEGPHADLKFGQKLIILSATGGVSGTFATVDNDFASGTIVVGKVVYEPNDVALEGAQGSFKSIDSLYHLTGNQKEVAAAIDTAAGDPRAAKLVAYLDNRPLRQLPTDFDRIAPEEVSSVFRIGASLSDVQARNVQRRTADLRAGTTGFSAAGFQSSSGAAYGDGTPGAGGPTGDQGTIANAAPERRWGTFVTGVGDFVHVGNSANAEGYDLNTGGVTAGADYKLNDHLAVGVTAGYAGTNANLSENGRMLVNGGKVGAYGTYYTGGFYTDAAVSGGYNNYAIRRTALQGDAFGSTQGSEVDGLVSAGYDWKLDALTIGPTAAFQYTYMGMDAFTEHSSLAPLHYGQQHESSIRSSFGLRVSYDWKIHGVIVRPEGELSWQHEYGDRSYSIDSSLASGAGSTFSVADTQIGRDSFLFGGGVSVLWNPRTSTYLFYDADLLTKEYFSQSVTGGLRMNF